MNSAPARSPWAARPRNVAIAAAAVAVMVCGAIWPMPIVGAGGALIAAFALYAGIRQMIAEHREAQHAAALQRAVARLRYLGEDQAADLLEAWARGEHPEHDPDESGPDPDSARTDPDTTDPRATDQPGHDPDDADTAVRGVQQWMALDLHRALGRGTNVLPSCQHQGFNSWADWWSDLIAQVRRGHTVAVARGVVPAGWYCSHCGRGDAATAADTAQLEEFQRAEAAEAHLALARDAHSRLAAYLAGFADVLDDTDRGPWANTGAVAMADLERALAPQTEESSR